MDATTKHITDSAEQPPASSNEIPAPEKYKKARVRKKKLFQSIREQMEFYFGDANLRRDKFLTKAIDQNEDGWVPLDTFMCFNKIKALTSLVEDIFKALSSSDMLEVKEIAGVKHVKRTSPIADKENIDECTVYIENIPAYADIDWLKKVFSLYGKVCYVSLPRYPTGELKSFAFVEFENEEGAKNVCQEFDSVIETDVSVVEESGTEELATDTDTGETIKEEAKTGTEKKEPVPEVESKVGMGADEDQKKRKREEGENPAESAAKKSKQASPDPSGSSAKKAAKKRRHRTKTRYSMKDDFDVINLRVLPKMEWKTLRKKYLQLQRESISEVKKMLRVPKDEEGNPLDFPSESKAEETKKGLEFVRGVIIKMKLVSVVDDVTGFKERLKGLNGVAYVDLQPGSDVAYVRSAGPKMTSSVLYSIAPEADCHILEGDEEKTYWDKIFESRKEKFESKERPKKRGIQKILDKVEKLERKPNHIFFDD